MKIKALLIILLLPLFLFAQNKAVPQKIIELKTQNAKFENYSLFEKNEEPSAYSKFTKSVSEVTILNLNEIELNKIYVEKPSTLNLKIPFQDTVVEIELYKEDILTKDFQVKDQNGKMINYQPGVYYKGTIKGNEKSISGFSFFENNVMGVFSSLELGNVIVGKSKDKSNYIAYNDKNLLVQNPFVCAVDELPENDKRTLSYSPEMSLSNEMTENCVRIYYELTYPTFLENGSDETETMNWITGIHNNISTLYTNDEIKMALSEVMIWTSQDPYIYDYGTNLNLFTQNTVAFNGDLAHLVNYPATTSVAYLDSLCGDFRYAYSGIDMFYEEVPVYSWTIMAMSHEMGHSMGSPHTHACSWNGNDTAIDGCGPSAGYSEGCEGEIPEEGGTIMSYCHLTWAGVNLALGFGPQPAALIRNTVDSKLCLGTDCIESCVPSIEDFTMVIDEAAGEVSVTIIDEISDTWGWVIYPYGTNPGERTIISTPNFEIGDLEPYVYYVLEVGNYCENGVYGNIITKTMILGDFCDQTFMDTGGNSSNYGDNEYLVKTFYPESPENKIKLTFTQFDLEADYDFIDVFNGNSTEAPLFENGGQLSGSNLPEPFISTADDGSLTFRFVSDVYVTEGGWEAEIDCDYILAVEDLSVNSVKVYPNPVTNLLTIEAEENIQHLKLLDASGKLILNHEASNDTEQLDMSHLPKGTYVLTIELKKEIVTKKIIKN